MGLRDLNIKLSYQSMGSDEGIQDFLIPAIKNACSYKRSVGFFSSSIFDIIGESLPNFLENNGKIKLVASPRLSAEDIEAINSGYNRRAVISKRCYSDFNEAICGCDYDRLKILSDLIAHGVMDIRIADVGGNGIYHDKLGVIEDAKGDIIVFVGSSNESFNGIKNNYEKIRVFKNWNESDKSRIEDEINEFNALWENNNRFIKVYDFSDSAHESIKRLIKEKSENKADTDNEIDISESNESSASGIVLRDYQVKAIESWVNNGYNGFFVMATGTGKTWTSIFAAKRIIEKKNVTLVVIAPYKHLIKQWSEDIERVFPKAQIILASSENAKWEREIRTAIIRQKYDDKSQYLVLATIATFNMDRFQKVIMKSTRDKLLIVDEAHRFTQRSELLKKQYKYMLGLSATPFSGKSAAKGNELMAYFGGKVFDLPIEEALERGYLVPYYYIPIYVMATPEEEEKFKDVTQKISYCFDRYGNCIDDKQLVKHLRNRLRIISMSENKISDLCDILGRVEEKNHLIVYCGDGKLFSENEEIRHIQYVKKVLNENGFKASQFTAKENIAERMSLIKSFDFGNITALAAIRCLDEGVNIQSIRAALILSSNDDYREFVQRRGRILRLYKNKKFANIYDVIVLPSSDCVKWAEIELRRFWEYARLAENKDELQEDLEKHLSYYEINKESLIYDFDEFENGGLEDE